MIAHKHITKAVAVLMVFAVCLCLCATAFKEKIKTYADSNTISMEYETELFDTETPMTVNIIMDSEDWEDMLSNASSEEYKECNVEINGTTFYRVGIRPKGNTSLSSIASDPTTDRYSFKLEFDHYVDGQTCFGLDKLILNNNYADATSMKEALVYDLFKYVGADASLYNYAKINVNGEYWGVYVALEAVEDSFLLRNYGVKSGELYKPESMGVGGGGKDEKQGGQKPESMTLPESSNQTEADSEKSEASASVLSVAKMSTESESTTEASASSKTASFENGFDGENMPNMPDEGQKGGGFSMSSGGADLNYIDDELDSYSTIWDGEVTDSKKADHKRVVTALKNISEGTDLENYMDIDNLVKYMAVHVFSVNDDSLSGSMAHNYYLYESDGKLNLIPWDYNLAFGGMGGGNNATSVVNEAIDNAFSATNFFDTLTENEDYNALYYENLEKVSEYISGGEFEKFYNRVRSQIDELVKTDPTAFYSYDEYTEAAETLYEIVKLRGESIEKQLSGAIPSTAELQKTSDSLVDASSLNLSVMGSMNGGNKGGFDVKNVNAAASGETAQKDGESTASAESDNSKETKAAQGEAAQNQNDPPDMPQGQNGSPPQMPNGEAPNGMAAPNAKGEETATSAGKTESTGETESADKTEQKETETASSSDTSSSKSTDSGSQNRESAPNDGNQKPDGNSPGGGQMNQPGDRQDGSSSQNGKNFIVYGICLGIMLLFLLFAALYKRRPGKG